MPADKLFFATYDQHKLQQALIFIATGFDRSGNNPKPVVLHSLRVALLLAENNASQDAVIAGLLHDCLEDTDATAKDIVAQFGKHVADIVDSVSFDKPTADLTKKFEAAANSFKRSLAIGQDALAVRACDLVDNSWFYNKDGNPELNRYLHKKFALFMELAKPSLQDTPFWSLLQQAYKARVEPLANV